MFSSNRFFLYGLAALNDCQTILRVAKPEVKRMAQDLLKGRKLSERERTMYRYYCEAVLVFAHMQRPVDVEALTVSPSLFFFS